MSYIIYIEKPAYNSDQRWWHRQILQIEYAAETCCSSTIIARARHIWFMGNNSVAGVT